MPPINVLIKPASANCNMRCDYCFYYDIMSKRKQPSYGFMTVETLEAVIRKVLVHADESCTFTYQGGEPTLRGLGFFEASIELQKKHNVNHVKIQNAFQTNGYHLTLQWADFFVKNRVLVGVSLDGPPRLHDCYRKNINGEGTFSQVMKNIEMLKKAGVDFNILSVINGKTAPDIKKTYEFYRKSHLNYLQFIACLDPLGEEPGHREYSLAPQVYGRFLIDLFGAWFEDLKMGKQPYIRQFENYIAILLGQMPESCDMNAICGIQYTIEADGSVYPCDFYVIDKYRLGNLSTDSMETISRVAEESNFVKESLKKEEICRNCRYAALCRGGCRRTRQEEKGYHQYFCSSYKMFFDACLPSLLDIAEKISR